MIFLPGQIEYRDISTETDGPLFELLHNVCVYFDDPSSSDTVLTVIPKGFRTDFGSVPKWFRPIIANVCSWDPVYLFHDWVFSTLYKGPAVTFAGANRLLRAGVRERGCPKWKGFLVYYAVELGGEGHWRTSE